MVAVTKRNQGHRYRERIDRRAAGRSVIDWLEAQYRHSSREVWRDRIERGEVTLDERSALSDERLELGQELVWSRPPWEEPAVPLDYLVLHEDPSLVAVSK